MKFSSIELALRGLQDQLNSFDVNALSGADASRVVDVLVPAKNQLDAFVLAVSARAVAANQHNAEGARSGGAWMGKKAGVSERCARSQLSTMKALVELPDVEAAVRSGSMSLEMASAITRGADGDKAVARELFEVAKTGTVEMVHLRAQELRSKPKDPVGHRERLCKSQYVNLRSDQDSMVVGSVRLLPELATGLLEAQRQSRGDTAYERAESFARKLGEQGKRRTEVVFHLDLDLDENGDVRVGDRLELKGVGPVPFSSLAELLESVSTKLVGTAKNKLLWFSEQDRRSTTSPLPEFIKRAIRAKAYDRCEVDGCVDVAEHVDHITARCNKGINDESNLQAICEADHHAKTKKDAPWTAGGVYGKQKPPLRDTG